MIRWLRTLWSGRLARTLVTLLIAAVGGSAAEAAGVPAGWFAGGLLLTAVASLAGLNTDTPSPIRLSAYLVLGIFAGTGVSPETLNQMQTWPVSFLILTVSMVLVIATSYWWLHRVSGWDRTSSLLASLPGALSFIMSAAESLKADMKRVIISQSFRVLILVEGIPLVMILIGQEVPIGGGSMPTATATESAALLAAGIVGGFLLNRTGMPGGIMIGALAMTGVLYLSGAVDGALPRPVMIPFVVALGAVAGARFRPGDLPIIKSLAIPALVAFAITIVITMGSALLVSLLVGVELLQVFLAFAPGAVDALVIVAFALDADPAYVVAHHVVRIVLLALALPFVFRWIARQPRAN